MMEQRQTKQRQAMQQGSVMVLAMLVTLVILGVGITAMVISSSGMKMSGNINRRHEAISSAEVGAERALAVLTASSDWDSLLNGTTCQSSHPLDRIPTVSDMKRKGRILCDPSISPPSNRFLAGVKVMDSVANAHQMDGMTYTVYIKNDPLEVSWRGAPAINDDEDHRVVLRVEGTGKDGLSFVAMETTIMAGAYGSQGYLDIH